ncbi:MAG TPA: energy transducer TonB [Bacteroidia bacterium]|nr:energy transducer TonB [Bacteroidia bacterium]
MKKILLSLFAGLLCAAANAQFVARMEVKEPLPGACDSTNVYALFTGFTGQIPPVAPWDEKQLGAKLQNIQFLKDNPKFKGKMMINCIINCKGEMIKCTVDNKSGNDELDKQVLAIFQDMKKWTPGTLDGNAVDTTVLYSIEIKKGKITVS